jgi:hypothetical protein
MPAPLVGIHLDQAVLGDPVWIGSITGTVAKDNGSTAVTFNSTGDALCGKTLLLVPDVACYVKQVAASGTAVTAANGVPLAAGEKFYMSMRRDKGFLSVLPVAGTVVLKVFEMNG